MKPIKVTIWERGPYCGDGHQLTRTFLAHGWGSARRLALRYLPATLTTSGTYHRDTGRAPYAELSRRGRVETVEPEVLIVSSVGELGYY